MDSDSKGSGRNTKRSVGKKVSFSIFEVNTFDEIAKIRKIKERELDNFILNKIQTNQYISSMKYKNNIKQNISRNNQKKAKEDINKKIGNKENFHLKYYLTDEDNNESNEKYNELILSKDINKKETINEKKLDQFIKIINNIFYMNNNKLIKKKIKYEIFQELKEYNEYLINQYLDYENNDEEYKKYIESKKIFFRRKMVYDEFIGTIKKIHYNKLIKKKK